MPQATLTVSIPSGAWIHDVSVDAPETVFRVMAMLSGDEHGHALLEIETENPVPILAAIDGRDDVTEFELLWKQDETTMVQVETTRPLLLWPVLEAGIPLETPFEIRDGEATWEITTSSARLSALGERLDEAGIAYDLGSVTDEPVETADRMLTERQREVVVVAAEQGYYETPRRATLTEVSESLGISKATGSDVLHRAEGKVMTWFIEEYLKPEEIRAG